MTNNGNNNENGHGATASDDFTGFTYELEEPITVKGFSVTYDRKFNTGNFESLNPAVTIWVKTTVPEGEAFDLHHAGTAAAYGARERAGAAAAAARQHRSGISGFTATPKRRRRPYLHSHSQRESRLQSEFG